jgi:hypothetical protein
VIVGQIEEALKGLRNRLQLQCGASPTFTSLFEG